MVENETNKEKEMTIEQIIAADQGAQSALEDGMNDAFWNFAKTVTSQEGNDGRVAKDNYGSAAKVWDKSGDEVLEALGYTTGSPAPGVSAAVKGALGLLTAPQVSTLLGQTNGNLLTFGQQAVQNALQTLQQTNSQYENQIMQSPDGKAQTMSILKEKLGADESFELKGSPDHVVTQLERDGRLTSFARNYLGPGANPQAIGESFKDYLSFKGYE